MPKLLLIALFLTSLIGCSTDDSQGGNSSSTPSISISSSPTPVSPTNPAAAKSEPSDEDVPVQSLGAAGELASYYNRHLVIQDGTVYGWTGDDQPQAMLNDAVQVGVGDTTSFALLRDGRLVTWTDDPGAAVTLAKDIVSFSAGRTGIFVIDKISRLWRFDSLDKPGVEIAKDVVYSSIGDGADYYITKSGDLFVKGLAHRGQYGNGSLESSPDFIKVASEIVQVRGHTGHAILLTKTGEVQGTGGNIYGPLGTHGLGDKATTWGTIFTEAKLIATGSSHSAAVKRDGTLWLWGAKAGTTPKQVMEEVVAVAAGVDVTLAKKKDGTIWFWHTGKEPIQIM